MAPVLNMLAHSYGIGPRTAEHPLSLEAAQANLMASVAKGLFGGHLPWNMIAIGAVIGVAVILLDQFLKSRGAKFRVPVLAAAIGIYLPLETMVPIFLGGLLNYLVTRSFGTGLSEDEVEKRNRRGMLFAAGLITGEALLGIIIGVADLQDRERRGARAAGEPADRWLRSASGWGWRCSRRRLLDVPVGKRGNGGLKLETGTWHQL